MIQLQGLDASTYAELARSSGWREVRMPALRGTIVDRNGEPLARSVETVNITVDQRLVAGEGNAAAYALQLSELLDADVGTIQRALTGERPFAYVAKDVAPDTWRQIRELGLTGIFAESSSMRTYPAGAVAGNVTGFAGAEGHGLAGLELSYEDLLSGNDGVVTYEAGAGGERIPLGDGSREESVPGEGLQLTLDRDLQWFAQQAIAEQVSATRSRAGNVVVLDAQTGELLVMATAPSVDPNDPGSTQADDRGNRVVQSAYEPGSVFKPLTMSAVIEEGEAEPDTVLTVPGAVTRSGETINDYYAHGPDRMTLAGVLAKSSNVGTLLAAERVSGERFRGYLAEFGIGAPLDLGLPAETRGHLPTEWSNLTHDTVSFGQGVSVNTVQMASAYATIANGGVRVPPRVASATIDVDGTSHPVLYEQPRRVVSEETAADVTTMMEAVMGPGGTGRSAGVDGYRVAGKTGTAQRVDPACGCYRDYNASFMGFAPADDARYVVAVSLLDPKSGNSGGALAGPVFAEVMEFTLHRMGVPPSETEPPEVELFAQ